MWYNTVHMYLEAAHSAVDAFASAEMGAYNVQRVGMRVAVYYWISN